MTATATTQEQHPWPGNFTTARVLFLSEWAFLWVTTRAQDDGIVPADGAWLL